MADPTLQDFSDQVAIVTGAGAKDDGIGNGRATALLLARRGARVVCVDRCLNLAERTVSMLQDEGGHGLAIGANVTEASECARIVEETMTAWGRIDLLDNNVGIGSSGTVVEETLERWQKVMDVNVNSMFQMSRAVIPIMETQGQGGAIVNIASISALRPRGLTAYSTSKGAVMALTSAMAVDHAAAGIRVNCVAPGPVFTPMVDGGGMSAQMRDTRRRASPLQIEGNGWDIGEAVCFLLSASARFVTGQTLVVDGGVTLRGPER
ncbi:MAG: SDR family NAD(P)-dependent oxidoreductase [Pseudomonadota bacterium]